MSSGRDDLAKFQAVDAEIVGISANISFSQKAFADSLKLNYPLLSDFPNLTTIQGYGVLIPERRLAQRSYFIVDKQGGVRYKKILGPKEDLVPNDTLIAELKKIN